MTKITTVLLATSNVSRGMTRAGTTPVITKVKRFASLVGLEAAALDTASPGMTRSLGTSTVIRTETKDVCKTGRDHLVRTASKTGSVQAVPHTVCLKRATSSVITSKSRTYYCKSSFSREVPRLGPLKILDLTRVKYIALTLHYGLHS